MAGRCGWQNWQDGETPRLAVISSDNDLAGELNAAANHRLVIAGVCHSLAEAAERLPAFEPHALLLDARLANNPLESLAEIKDCFPGFPVVLLLPDNSDPSAVLAMLDEGASVLARADLPAETESILHSALIAHPNLSSTITRDVTDTLRRSENARWLPQLTPAENGVLPHLLRFERDQQIADALCLSVKTVQAHVRHIYSKLGVNSRRELIQKLRR